MNTPRQFFHRLWTGIAALALITAFSIPMAAQSVAKEALVIYLSDNTKVSYILETKPTVKFGDTNVLIESPAISDSHGIADVAYFRFEKVQESGLTEVADHEQRIAITEAAVTIYGLQTGASVSAFDIQGRLLATVSADDNGIATISTEKFVPGVYVVTTPDSHSFKIYKH